MANKDFKANQIRISTIIGSGSITGGSPHTMIYSASVATDFIGGIDPNYPIRNVGRDVGLFVSGGVGSRSAWKAGTAVKQGGATLIGGDLHVSGNITTEGIPIGGVVTGSFNEPVAGGRFVTTASVSFAGPLDSAGFGGFSYAVPRPAAPLKDAFFFVSGTKSSSGRTRDAVPNPAVAVFGGDLVVSGTLYAERQVIEVDETVDGDFLISGSMQVEKGSTFNVSAGPGSDFRVISQNDTHALFVDSNKDTVAIGTNAPGAGSKLHIGNATKNQRVVVFIENEVSDNYDTQISFAKEAAVSYSIGVDDSDSDKLKIVTGQTLGTATTSLVEIHQGGVNINEDGQDRDFRVESQVLEGAVLVDAGTNQISFATNGTSAASAYGIDGFNNDMPLPDDILVYLSGTIADDFSRDRGSLPAVVVAAGDMVVSGTLLAEGDMHISGTLVVEGSTIGTMSSFTIRDPAANTSTITNGDTLNFVNTANETTVAVSGDNVTVGLAATAVTPGSYVSADITVDANGRITAASNGPAGTVTNVAVGSGLDGPGGGISSTGTISLAYASPSNFISAATDGTGITIDPTNDKLALFDSDASEVKFVNVSQLPAGGGGGGGTVSSGSFNEPVVGGVFVTTASLSLAGGFGFSHAANTGNDAYFFVSGSINAPEDSTKIRKVVFGGDTVMSGALQVNRSQPLGNRVTITSDGKVGIGSDTPAYKLSVGGNMDVGEYIYHKNDADTFFRFTTDAINVQAGNENIANFEGPDVPFRQRVLFLSGGAGSSYDEVSDKTIQFYVSGTVGSPDGVIKDRGLSLFGGDLVISGNVRFDPNDQAQKFTLGKDPVESYFKSVGPVPTSGGKVTDIAGTIVRMGYDVTERIPGGAGVGDDSNIFFSGSIDSRGTSPVDKHRRGTAVFGGDVVISGSLRGRQLHFTTHKGTSMSTNAVFVRFDANGFEPSPNDNTHMNAPFGGRLKKIVFRSSLAIGSTDFSFHKNGPGNATLNPTATATVTSTPVTNNSLHLDFPDTAIFDNSEIIGLKFDPTNNPGDVTVTCVWEFDTHDPLP